MGSTTSSTSAAITAPPLNTEPPGPRPSRPGPRSLAWPLGYRRWYTQPSCALSRPEPIKLTVPQHSGSAANSHREALMAGLAEALEGFHPAKSAFDTKALVALPQARAEA